MKYLAIIGLLGIGYFLFPNSKTYTVHLTEQSPEVIDTVFRTPFNNTLKFSSEIKQCSNDTILFFFVPYASPIPSVRPKVDLSVLSLTDIAFWKKKQCDISSRKWGWSDMRDDFPFVQKGSGIQLYYNKLKAKKVDITVTTTFWGY